MKNIWGKLFFVVILAVYLFPFSHDPWKPDEGYSFGLVYHAFESGDWVVPQLAGEPFMEKPPLFFLVASEFAHLFAPPLAVHDAARIAAPFFMVIAIAFLILTTRKLYGSGWPAAAILVCCFGLFEFVHYIITDLALMAGFAIAFYGLAIGLARPYRAGFFVGTGLGVGFMAKGLLAVGIIGLTAALLPLIITREWWRKEFWYFTGASFLAAIPWLTIWPAALWLRDPFLFGEWFWTNNWGRFLGANNLGPSSAGLSHYLEIIPWFAFPAWPLALWTLWSRGWRASSVRLPIVYLAVMVFVLSVSADGRQLYALPFLLPLAALGAGAVEKIARVAWINILGLVVFGFLIFFVWGCWFVLQTGWPAVILHKLTTYQPGYAVTFNGWVFAIALAGTLVWLGRVVFCRQGIAAVLINWTTGIAVVWLLVGCFLVPFLDVGKTYREIMLRVKKDTGGAKTIATCNLGETQRAMLHYFAGAMPVRAENNPAVTNKYLLLQTDRDKPIAMSQEWTFLWQDNRPGDDVEITSLYERADSDKPSLVYSLPTRPTEKKHHMWLFALIGALVLARFGQLLWQRRPCHRCAAS